MTRIDDENTVPNDSNSAIDRWRAAGAFEFFEVRDWAGDSVVGLVRGNNEDRWCRVSDSMYVVADGMGGHDGGEIASQAIIDVVAESGEADLTVGIDCLVHKCNEAVLSAGLAHGVENLGSTLVLLALRGQNVIVAGVGDSRIYRYRDGVIMQLTQDHTVRGELLEAGINAEPYRERGVRLDALTSYVGFVHSDPPQISSASFAVSEGDRYLLCTDGVHGQMKNEDLISHLKHGDCSESVAGLLTHADAAGGRDNATAVVLELGYK